MKEALVVVDMQNDFLSGSLGSAEAVSVLPAVRKRIASARSTGATIVFTRDTHGDDYFSTQEGRLLPVAHCRKDTEGWQLASDLKTEGDEVFDKNSFGSLELARYLQAEKFERICFVGVCTDICVVSNALLAKTFCPEAELVVFADCCAGTTKAAHEAALSTLSSCQVRIERAETRN